MRPYPSWRDWLTIWAVVLCWAVLLLTLLWVFNHDPRSR